MTPNTIIAGSGGDCGLKTRLLKEYSEQLS